MSGLVQSQYDDLADPHPAPQEPKPPNAWPHARQKLNAPRIELEKVIESGRFTTTEAKHLMGLDWHSLTCELPAPIRQQAAVLYDLI